MNWNKGYDIDALLTRLRLLSGSVDSELYLPVLVSAARFDPLVPEAERLAIVRQSVATVLAEPDAGSSRLGAEMSRWQSKYMGKAEEQMTLVTSISLGHQSKIHRRTRSSISVLLSQALPKAFSSIWLNEKSQLHGVAEHPESYTKVRIVVSARSAREVAERGFLTLDYLRGIWNFALGFRRYKLTLVGVASRPFNAILLGPQFSVHKKEGDLAEEGLGVVGGFREVAPVARDREIAAMLSWEKNIERRLRSIPYRKEVEDAFIRYARSLDEVDHSSCLLEVWGLIENLTDTLRAKYDITMKRVASLFPDPQPHLSVLQHLREHRNGIAHAGRQTEFGEMLVSQAKYYVEELFDFHLMQGRNFSSLAEAGEFLDLPSSIVLLGRQIELRKLAWNHRRRGAK